MRFLHNVNQDVSRPEQRMVKPVAEAAAAMKPPASSDCPAKDDSDSSAPAGMLLALMIRFAADAVPLNGTRCTSIVIAPPVVLVAVNLSTWARVLAGVVYWVVIAVSQFLDSINGFAMVVMLAPVPQFGG